MGFELFVKEMRHNVRHIQARRIRCVLCKTPFTCLVEWDFMVATTAIRLLNSDEGMRKVLARQAAAKHRTLDGKHGREVGLCPRCRCYQPWMVQRSRWTSTPVKFGGALAALFVAFGTFTEVFHPEARNVVAYGVLASISMAAGIGISWLRALPEDAQRGLEDPRVCSDDDMRRLLARARETGREPVLDWYLSLHDASPEDRELVSAGCRDSTGEAFFPPEFETEGFLGNLAGEK